MSTDRADTEPATGIDQRLPSRSTVREGLLTLGYLAALLVAMTLLVTLELAVRH